jgi:hypothetical protein
VLEMKNGEGISEYFGRVLAVPNQMRTNGEEMTDLKIVEKILRTLTEKYLFVVVSIEESKDIDQKTIDELQSTLLVHEQKFKKTERDEEQAFKVEYGENSRGRGHSRGRFGSQGRGRGRQSFNKDTIECYKCHIMGHLSYECPEQKEANYAGFDEAEEVMLMAQIDDKEISTSALMAHDGREDTCTLWFLDSGCSNHMCGRREKFINLDTSCSHSVRLGNNTRLQVAGKG